MDDVDLTTERQVALDGLAMLNYHQLAASIEVGCKGECFKCGNESARLMDAKYFKAKGHKALAIDIEQAEAEDPNIKGVCAPCRDRHHLP